MKYFLSLIIAFFFVYPSYAQSHEPYTWEKDPQLVELQPDEASLSELYLLKHVQYEYIYEDNNNSPIIYFTNHEIVRVNNDEAVAANNRIYIPMRGVLELVEVRARTINPDGSVVEIDKKDIKEIEDEEAGAGYKIFAIDGAQVGGEIEFYYTSKMAPDFFGREYFQFESPLKKASFKLISPKNLQFEFKCYKDFPEVNLQESAEEKNVYTVVAENIPGLKPEPFSVYNGNRKRIEFKLAYNSVNGNVRLFTWSNAGKNLYGQMHNLDKKEEKQAEKILKDIKIDQYDNNYLKAAAIEDYVKTNYYIDENASGETYSIAFIAKNKFTSKYGITRLMVTLLEKANIPLELVLTSDRSDVKFDGEFDSYNYLEEYLIYLPEEDKYIAPYYPQYRLDMTPPQFTANQGLFVKTMKVRDYVHPISEIKTIAPATAAENADDMFVSVNFNDDLSANTIHLKRSIKGYQASYLKAMWPLLEEKKREDLLKELVKFMTPDADIETIALEKIDTDFRSHRDPLVLNSQFRTPAFIERAGPILLFKVGELIGPQSELYQEEKRILPVENEYNRSYWRKISVAIPEGYEIQNLKDMVIDENAQNEAGETVYSFKSTYEIKDGHLNMEIKEYYKEVYYPVEKFEDFRKVINAAADFNKIVLVMKETGKS